MPTTTPWLRGLGGTAFVGAMVLLGWMLWRAWRRALNVRHAVPLFAYAAAIGFVLVGGTLGALMGGRAIPGELYLQVRHAHLTANVLGWASLTVVGTLITLLPTALRVRMPHRRERMVIGLLSGGVLLQVAGWLADSTLVLAAGGVAFAVGALGFIGFVAAVLRTERRWAVPVAAFHMLAAFAWFVVGSVGLAVALFHRAAGADRYREVFLTVFVGGWLVQVLLGAWSYLLPMARPGHPTDRRRWLSVFELAAPIQVALLNAGLLLLAASGAGWLGPGLGRAGALLALTGGGLALAKAWLFAAAEWPAATRRARAVWGE